MAVVSEQLKTFLQQRLSSLQHIDVVLLLYRDPSRSWTAVEVASALGTAPETATMRLFLLASGGLIVFEPDSVPRYRYAGSEPETDAMIQQLSEISAADPAALAAAVEGPRDPIRSFADAFKLKK